MIKIRATSTHIISQQRWVKVALVVCMVSLTVVAFSTTFRSFSSGSRELIVASPVCGTWYVMGSEETGINLKSTYFGAVNALSTDDIWFAGTSNNDALQKGAVVFMHWNGGKVNSISNSMLDTDEARFEALTMRNKDDGWAVGYYKQNGQSQPLVVHWNGSSLNVLPIPELSSVVINNIKPQIHGSLKSIAIVASDDVWAVGEYLEDTIYKTLVVHWNGNKWETVPSPNIGRGSSTLQSIVALSTNDVWAFGSGLADIGTPTWLGTALVLHWDGHLWKVADKPLEFRNFTAASVGSDKDLRVVGSDLQGEEFWAVKQYNSAAWDVRTVPNSTTGYGEEYRSLIGNLLSKQWLVGYKWAGTSSNRSSIQSGSRALVMQWNGQTWQEVEVPDYEQVQEFRAATSMALNDLWLVGAVFNGENQFEKSIIEHFVECPATSKN